MARNNATAYYDRFVRNSAKSAQGRLSKEQFRVMMEDIAFCETRGINYPHGEASGRIEDPASNAQTKALNQLGNLENFFISLDGKRITMPTNDGKRVTMPAEEGGYPDSVINGSYSLMAVPTPFEYQIPRPTRITTPTRLEIADGLKDPKVRLTAMMMHLVYAHSMLDDLGDREGSEEIKRCGMAVCGAKVFTEMLDWMADKRLISDFVWT